MPRESQKAHPSAPAGDPETVLQPPLLQKFEETIGVRLSEIPKRGPGEWPWSWTPQQAAYFLGMWESSAYCLNALLYQLAFTRAPIQRSDGSWGVDNQLMYEKACKPEIRQAIDRAEDVTSPQSGSGQTPYPHGDIMVDLRQAPPLCRPTTFTINDHTFFGVVKVNQPTASQLRAMHGAWYYENLRLFMAFDQSLDLGEVRA